MSIIPLHKLGEGQNVLGFEVIPWTKEVNKYDTSTPHRHAYYEMLIFTKGGGIHEIDFIHYPIKSRSIHFVASNQVHEVRRKPGSDGFSLLFAQEFLPDNYKLRDFDFYQAATNPVLSLNTAEFKELSVLLDELKKEFFSENVDKREVLCSLLQVLLLKASRYYKQNVAESANRKIAVEGLEFKDKLERAIEENYSKHWRANDYASHLNMSVTQLNALSKQYFSRSTETLIQDRVLVEIKRLLAYTTKPVKEICYDLNFDDPAYFTRFFKKKTGLSPMEYRNAVNEG